MRGKSHQQNKAPSGNGYWIYGKHACEAALTNPRRKIQRCVATASAAREMERFLNKLRPEILEAHAFSKFLPHEAVHQGIALQVAPLPDIALEDIMQKARLLVVLDQITDPHNIGAILRSCAAFDVDAVIATRDHAPQETATLAKSASGALEMVPVVRVTNLAHTLNQLKSSQFWVIGLDADAPTTLQNIPDYEKRVVVLGAEGKGVRKLVQEQCDLVVRLPMSKRIESLNVSNAAAITLSQLYMQKNG